MRAVWIVLVGCSATSAPDAGSRDAGLDASVRVDAGDGVDAARTDVGVDAAPASDAWVHLGDAWVPPDLLCGGVVPGAPCPTQDPATASACGTEGRVVFDGARCALVEGPACGPERGAFASFEACALACEPEHCFHGALLVPWWWSDGRPPDYVEECPPASEYDSPLWFGFAFSTDVPFTCPGFGPLECGNSRCGYAEPPAIDREALGHQIRAATVMPFVRAVEAHTPRRLKGPLERKAR